MKTAWTEAEITDVLTQCSDEELLQWKELLDQKLELRGINEQELPTYVLNTNTHKFHIPTCSSVTKIKEKNKLIVHESRESVIDRGYEPCGICHP